MAELLEEFAIRLGIDVKGDKQLADVGKTQDTVSTKSVALGTALGNLGADLVKLGAQALQAAAAFAVDVVQGFAAAGDEIAKTAKSLAVGTDELQRLQYAGERSGVATDKLNDSIGKMRLGLEQALIDGAGPLAKSLDSLGLSAEDLVGLSVEEQLGMLGDALNGIEDDYTRAALVQQIFGDGNKRMTDLLAEGSAGISGLGDEAERLGLVIEGDALKSAEALTDAMFNVDQVVEAAKNQVGAALAPVVTDIADRFANWIAENDDFIKQDLPKIIEGIIDAAEAVLPYFVDFVTSIGDLIKEVDQLDERLEQDWPNAWATAQAAIEAIRAPIQAARDLIADLVDYVVTALEKVEGLADTVKSIKAGLGGGDEQQAERGAPKFLGGGKDLVGEAAVDPSKRSPEELKAIADSDRYTDEGRARARAAIPAAETRIMAEKSIEAARAAEAAAKKQAEREAKVAEARARAEERRKSARKLGQARARRIAGGGGGGGGGGAPTAEEPSVEDLIAGATGMGVLRGNAAGGGAAPGGPVINNIDARFDGSIEVNITIPGSKIAGLSSAEAAEMLGNELGSALDRRNRQAFDQYRRIMI
ncbi:MAG: hypothetical protein KC457_02995 [Myxococcales bacterium]|nr:hypothetical protein [Myxococcales bacterium]